MARQQDPEHDLDPLLRQALRPSSVERTDACLDAETVAAWADGALRWDEVAAVEQHASDCARCRTVLAAVVRSDVDAPGPVRDAAASPLPWWRRWQLAWLVPITATATAVAVYIASPDAPAPTQPGLSSRVGMASDNATDKARAEAEAGLANVVPTEPAQASSETVSQSLRELPKTVTLGDANTTPATAAPAAAPAAADREAARGASALAVRVAPPAASGASAPVGGASSLALSAETIAAARSAAAPAAEERADKRTDAPAAPRLERAQAGGVSRDRPAQSDQLAAAEAARDALGTPLPLRENAADGRQRTAARLLPMSGSATAGQWRVTGTALERSTDGRTWTLVSLPNGVDASQLSAAGAASAQTVWLVGRGGLVLHASEDAPSLRRATPPVAADLVGVEARSGSAATVVTADGRRFDTADGGATWALAAP